MLSEAIKEEAIRRIHIGKYSYGIGERLGRRLVSITVVVPEQEKDLCSKHHLPIYYLMNGEKRCPKCVELQNLESNFSEELLYAAA